MELDEESGMLDDPLDVPDPDVPDPDVPDPYVPDPEVPEPVVLDGEDGDVLELDEDGELLELEPVLEPEPGEDGTLDEELELDPLSDEREPEPGAGLLGDVLLEELLPVPDDAGRRSSPQATRTLDRPATAAITRVLFSFMSFPYWEWE